MGTIMKQFKPHNVCPKYKLKNRYTFDWKWIVRQDIPNIMDRIMADLHHLGSHSYVTYKWRKVERKFFNQHPTRF